MVRFAQIVLCCVLIGLLRPAAAQKNVRIDSLPDKGVQLRTGWRWHPGDNGVWAKPDFDDSGWDTIQPGKNIRRLPQLQRSPMGWLRLAFELDSSAAQTPLSLGVSQTGASEIYLDGKLYQRIGRVGSTYQQEKGFTPSAWDRYLLPRLSAGRHVFAVRLSQHRPPWYVPKRIYFISYVFAAKVFPAKGLTSQTARQTYIRTLINYLIVGLFLMLGAIHLLYFGYRRQQINLVFALTTLSCSVLLTLGDVINSVNDSQAVDWIFFAQRLSLVFFMTFLLATYYIYLKQRLSWFFWLIAAGLFLPQIMASFYEEASPFFTIAIAALFFDGIRICVVAMRRRQANARLVLNSLLTLVVIAAIGSVADYSLRGLLSVYIGYSVNVIDVLFFLTFPISFAIILARDYAQTNRNLEERLIEVEQLSTEKESILKEQNETLERQVKARTTELSQSLTDLRDTQQQLIQREKMASLGELTAGVAHEIQNPLNFVNNFAEVSAELVEELSEELEKADGRDEDLENEILADLRQNLQKISQHGGRASSIVRGMLEHSRSSTGDREPTDINALVDEYMKLAYHGIRAKNKDGSTSHFNTQLVTHFDSGVGTVTVMPQELGRVLLNLFNNAFYALQEKQKGASTHYQPTLTVSTKRLDDTIEICVSDNGTGIAEGVKEKIFNPFFTTKPTGQGTGLGLSLSYDIITKGHNGTLNLETTLGYGTTFIIRLPVTHRLV